MDAIREIMEAQVRRHGSMTCQDAVKMCFQGCFGPGHLLADREKAYAYFMEEFNKVKPEEGLLYEEISPWYVRVNFSAYKKAELPADWLFQMFYLTANGERDHVVEYENYLAVMGALAEEGETSFSKDEWDGYVESYLANGGGAVHHSNPYRVEEKPHYRVVSKKFVLIFPVLSLMAERQKKIEKATVIDYQMDDSGEMLAVPVASEDDEILVLAIEGRAASGKTTTAKMIADVVGGALVHMDHFFLPPSLRKPKRLREYGGNVHYEYFKEAVVPYLKERSSFSYTAFDCGSMKLADSVEVPVMPWRIVEGAYSTHPTFGDYADITVFMDVDPDEQIRRIRKRNGDEMLKRFRDTWIPMEEAFFFHGKQQETADIVLEIRMNDTHIPLRKG